MDTKSITAKHSVGMDSTGDPAGAGANTSEETGRVDDTRTRILSSAGEVFAAKGFRGATVREICRRAEVNLAAVNYHFGDKQALYQETVAEAHRTLVEQVPMPAWQIGTPPEERLHGLLLTLLTRMLSQTDSWERRLMMREVLEPTEACRRLVQDYFQPHFELLQGILDELLPKDTPAFKRRQIGFSIVGQCLFYRVSHKVVGIMVPNDERQAHFRIEDLARHITQWSLAALGRAPGSPSEQTDGSAS